MVAVVPMGDEKVTGGPARSHLPGKRTTAMEIVRGFNLEGKTAVVTGECQCYRFGRAGYILWTQTERNMVMPGLHVQAATLISPHTSSTKYHNPRTRLCSLQASAPDCIAPSMVF